MSYFDDQEDLQYHFDTKPYRNHQAKASKMVPKEIYVCGHHLNKDKDEKGRAVYSRGFYPRKGGWGAKIVIKEGTPTTTHSGTMEQWFGLVEYGNKTLFSVCATSVTKCAEELENRIEFIDDALALIYGEE